MAEILGRRTLLTKLWERLVRFRPNGRREQIVCSEVQGQTNPQPSLRAVPAAHAVRRHEQI